MPELAEKNGSVNYAKLEEVLLAEPLTSGYKPAIPLTDLWGPDGLPFFQVRQNIEFMMTHPMVRNAMDYYKSGLTGAEFWGGPDPADSSGELGLPICAANPEVDAFVQMQCERFWNRGVPLIQTPGYEYGWAGLEACYCEEGGKLVWDRLEHFAPRDTFVLTQDFQGIGVRVKNVPHSAKPIDLWMASGDIPAKGMWYVHNPRWNRWYGQTQLLGAWRPWRRLAWKDGAETVLDGGVYRLAYAGPEVRFPVVDAQGPEGSPNTTLDSQGNPRRYARDIARQIGEQVKAGAAVALPSTPYSKDMGGGEQWSIKWPTTTLNCGPILDYIKNLHDQISYGIGVPPELLQAAETGSGYSGRAIPMEAFLDGQQRIGDAMLRMFVEQVLRPLVLWNFGDVVWDVKMKRLLKSKMKATLAQQTPQISPEGADESPQYDMQQPPPDVTQYRGPRGGQGFKDAQGNVTYGKLSMEDRAREIARRIAS